MATHRSTLSSGIWRFRPRYLLKIAVSLHLFLLLAAWNMMAMTPDDFIQFLTNSPSHGYVKVTKISHIHFTNRDVTNRLYKTYEHSWDGKNVVSKVVEDSKARSVGAYKSTEWNESDGNLMKYYGHNDTDAVRHNMPETMEFDTLMSLGISYLDRNSVKKEGSELSGDVYQPESPNSSGIKRHLKGEFKLSPDGNVKALECTVYKDASTALYQFGITYRFDGKWGTSFPSYLEMYLIKTNSLNDETPEESNVFEEREVAEWNTTNEPTAKELDPDTLFPSASEIITSNNLVYTVQKISKRDVGHLTPLLSSVGVKEQAAHQKDMKTLIRVLILMVACIPFVVWAVSRRQKEKTKP